MQDGLSYKEAARRYDVQGHDRIQSWERIYLEEGPEGLAVERRGRRNTGRPKKQPSKVEEDLLAEVRNRKISRRIKRPPSQCAGIEMAVGIFIMV